MSNALQLKRKSAGFTQAQLAKLVGVTERGYRCYEASPKAKRKSLPDILTAIRIADALKVRDLRELWQPTPENHATPPLGLSDLPTK